VHVLSRRYRVGVIGNVATRPDCRGRGYAAAVTAAVCRELLADSDDVGTNVRADNARISSAWGRGGEGLRRTARGCAR